jgi:hypothetical protein
MLEIADQQKLAWNAIVVELTFIEELAIAIQGGIINTLLAPGPEPCVIVTINCPAFWEMSMYLFQHEWFMDAPCPIRHCLANRRVRIIIKPDDDPQPAFTVAAAMPA